MVIARLQNLFCQSYPFYRPPAKDDEIHRILTDRFLDSFWCRCTIGAHLDRCHSITQLLACILQV